MDCKLVYIFTTCPVLVESMIEYEGRESKYGSKSYSAEKVHVCQTCSPMTHIDLPNVVDRAAYAERYDSRMIDSKDVTPVELTN